MAKPLSIGPVTLGGVPRIAAVVDRKIVPAALSRLAGKGASLLEIRMDLLPLPFEESIAYAESLKRLSRYGLIGTLRENRRNRNKREAQFDTILPWADAVDLEVEWERTPAVLRRAKGKTVIISHHDFEKTPPLKKLHETARRCADLGADIVKIAVMAREEKDVTALWDFSKECAFPLVAIAMGPLGIASRVMAPLFGSLWSYAYIGDKAVAPGQLNVEKLAEQFSLFYPEFKKMMGAKR